MSGNAPPQDDPTEDTPQDPLAEENAPPQPSGGGKKKKKGGKRPLNEFFKLMLKAKRSNAPSFVYKGTTYHGRKNGRLGMVYSKSKRKNKSASKSSKRRRRRRTKRAKGTKKRRTRKKSRCRNRKGRYKRC